MTMRIRDLTPALVITLALSACGGSGSADDAEKETVFDPMINSIDKAKGVEEQVLQQKDDIDEALRQAEEPDPEDDGTH